MTYLWSSEEEDDGAGLARAACPAGRRVSGEARGDRHVPSAWRRENFRPSIQTAPSRTNAEQPLPPAPHLHLHRPELKGVYRAILDSSSSGSSDVSSDEGNGEGDSMFSRTKRGPDGCGGAKGPPAALMRNKAAVSAARRAAERQRRRTMAAPDGTTVPGTHQGERPPRERLGRAVREALWLHLVETAGKEGGEGRSQHDQGVQVGSEEEEKEELQSRFRSLCRKEEEEELQSRFRRLGSKEEEEEDQQLLEELFGLPSLSAQLESERSSFTAAVSAANRQLMQPSHHIETPSAASSPPLSAASASPRFSSKKKRKEEAAKGRGQRATSRSRSSRSKLGKAASPASVSSSRHYRSPHQQQQQQEQSKAAASPLGTLPPFRH